MPDTTTPQPGVQIDRQKLGRYLQQKLPELGEIIELKAFEGGQSNPTYKLVAASNSYVLRKKPPGNLLRSAHAIDREYRVMNALQGHIPVPRMVHYCDDEKVIGQEFFLMTLVDGRVMPDARLLEAPPEERRQLSLELIRVLARLHDVNYKGVGLENFGRPDNYIGRQLARWSKQYNASKVEENAAMDSLISWLEKHLPAEDETAIVHGDYRSHNVIFAPDEPGIAAVLDWELSTIGHPLADLAYCCLPYYLPNDDPKGFQGERPIDLGIPQEREMLAEYCREAGRDTLPHWRYFIVFSLFRSAAIRAGVLKRARDGNASSSRSSEIGLRYRDTAACAWRLAQSGQTN